MPNAPKIKVTFEALQGGGEQLGWVHTTGLTSIPGLGLDYFPVFRSPETGRINLGRPMVLEAAAGARHTRVTFDSQEQCVRFFRRLKAALRIARPDLFLVEDEGAAP